ncbi:Ras and Rab interactor 1, partial [Ophiophagus hannah]
MQFRIALAFWAAAAHCWIIFNCLSSKTPRSLSPRKTLRHFGQMAVQSLLQSFQGWSPHPRSSVHHHLTRMTSNPDYDYPEPYANPRQGAVSLPHNISLVGRLRLTQPVWLQLGINSATALHILQREPAGTRCSHAATF